MKYLCRARHVFFEFENVGRAVMELNCRECRNFVSSYCGGPEPEKDDAVVKVGPNQLNIPFG